MLSTKSSMPSISAYTAWTWTVESAPGKAHRQEIADLDAEALGGGVGDGDAGVTQIGEIAVEDLDLPHRLDGSWVDPLTSTVSPCTCGARTARRWSGRRRAAATPVARSPLLNPP